MNPISISLSAHSDEQLVVAARERDVHAFREIVVRHQGAVCAVALSVTRDVHASEDVAQETFLTAWQSLRRLEQPAKLRAWLCGIARNLAKNRRREDQGGLAADDLLEIESAQIDAPDPAAYTRAEDEAAMVWRALAQLPLVYREPLTLFYREEQSVARVATALAISEDAAKQRLARGRRLLHDRLLKAFEVNLRRSAPEVGFTLAVLAALPMTSSSASAATFGATLAVAAGVGTTGLTIGALYGWTGAVVGLISGIAGGLIGLRASLVWAKFADERRVILRSAVLLASCALMFSATLFTLNFHLHAVSAQLGGWGVGAIYVGLIGGYGGFIVVSARELNRLLARRRAAHEAAAAVLG